MNISDAARQSGLNRSTISLLYHGNATRVDLEALEKLCKVFNCSVGEMLELKDGEQE